MATHSSILAWETHGQRSLGLQATVGAVTVRGGCKESDATEHEHMPACIKYY